MASQRQVAAILDYLAELYGGFTPSAMKLQAWMTVLGDVPENDLNAALKLAITTSKNPDFAPTAPGILACVGGKRHLIPVVATDCFDRVVLQSDGAPHVLRRISVLIAAGEPIPERLTDGEARRIEKAQPEHKPESLPPATLPDELLNDLGIPRKMLNSRRLPGHG